MTPARRLRPLLAAAALALLPAPAFAADTPHGSHVTPGAAVGSVTFPITCSAGAQQAFGQAVWLLHSFWYEESVKEFAAIATREPDCAMAHWGVAMSHWYPLWFPPPAAALKAGADAVARGRAAPPKTERERAYVEAIGAFYRDADTL